MLKGNFDYSVGSDVDFENLVADIGFDSKFVAMLTQETGFKDLRIRIYPPKDAEYWDFRFDEFEEIIQKARKKLFRLRTFDEIAMTDDLMWLQQWYLGYCNGTWERKHKIKIETVDTPGWHVTINLSETGLDNKKFIEVKREVDEENWLFCLVKENNFEASCGPRRLNEALRIFRSWVEICH